MNHIPRWYIIQVVIIAAVAFFTIYSFMLIIREATFVSEMHAHENSSPPQTDGYIQLSMDDTSSLMDEPRLILQENRRIRTNILFLKTHKTGSSTMQNILMRFGLKNFLNIMVPSAGNYLGYLWPLSTRSISASLRPTDDKYNIFACHSRYHQNTLNFMHNDTIRITLLRYPPKSFESLFGFFSLHKRINMTFVELAKLLPNIPEDLFKRNGIKDKSTNQMCYDLGLIVDSKTNDSVIEDFIRYVDKEFDFVMITEYFDVCLVMLADLMNWPLNYVAYFPILARFESAKSNMTREDEAKLRDLNKCDSLLYDHFLKKLQQRILQYGVDRLLKNLRRLHKLNEDFYAKCIETETNRGFWGTVGYALKPDADWDCIHATKGEFQFIDEIREKQMKRFAEERKLISLNGSGS